MFVREGSKSSPSRLIDGACALSIFLLCQDAGATFSIAAVDTSNGEMGAAVVSCVGSDFNLSEVVRMRPDVGVVIAQSYFYAAGRDLIFAELQKGALPSSAIAAALDPNFDPPGRDTGPSFRQYAALGIDGTATAVTGEDCLPFAGHLSGKEGSVVYVVSGNILTGEESLSVLQNAFVTSDARVETRLLHALRAIGSLGIGDARCSPLTGDAGYFELRLPGETSASTKEPAVSIEVHSQEGDVALALADRVENELATLPSSPSEGAPRKQGAEATSGCSIQRRLTSWTEVLLLSLFLGLILASRRLTWGQTLTPKGS